MTVNYIANFLILTVLLQRWLGDDGSLYVTHYFNDSLKKYRTSDGALLGTYTFGLSVAYGALSFDSSTNSIWVGNASTMVKIGTGAVGTINVSSNISSSWTITGPATITGSGTSQSSPAQPTGTYTITWNPVAGYTTPVSQSLTLTSGNTINFSGIYTFLGPTAIITDPLVDKSVPQNQTVPFSGVGTPASAPSIPATATVAQGAQQSLIIYSPYPDTPQSATNAVCGGSGTVLGTQAGPNWIRVIYACNITTYSCPVNYILSGTNCIFQPTITAYEWREGNCTTGTLLSSAANFNLSTPTTGVRTVYLRVLDSQGLWSNNCPSHTVTVIASAPDLTASVVTPQTALMGIPATFSATISNTGAPTGATFTDLIEISQVNNPLLFTDIYAKVATTSIALAAPGSNLAWVNYTFPTAGTWYVRACADTNTTNNGTITESNEGNNCSPTWTPVLVLDPATISFNGAGCVLPSGANPSCNVTSWWNVALPGVETVDIEVKGLGYAKVFKKLPINSSGIAKALDKTRNLATLFTAKPISVPQSSALQIPVSNAGSLNLSLQRSLDHFVLASLPPVVSCSSGETIVNGVCTILCANGEINPPTCDQCPNGQVYYSGVCMPCQNTGCNNGTGGTHTNPLGSPALTCNNGAPLPPLCAASCPLPWVGTIENNQSVTAYQTPSVTTPATCASVSQTRTCTAGTLSGSYMYQSCNQQTLKVKYQEF